VTDHRPKKLGKIYRLCRSFWPKIFLVLRQNWIPLSTEQGNIMCGRIGFLALAACATLFTGCTMCCHPYDECGPVYDATGGHSYCASARAGSILDDGASSSKSEAAVEEGSPGPNAAPTGPTPAESEPKILSITDRKVGETAAVAEVPHRTEASRHAGDYTAPATRRR
jgi:hypothetical protein